jgi:hypothetical protein
MYVAVGGQISAAYTGGSLIVDPLGATRAGLGDAKASRQLRYRENGYRRLEFALQSWPSAARR